MTVQDVGRSAVEREQAANWDDLSDGWAAWREPFEAAASTVSDRLVELAGLRAGDRVLDFGTGLGEPARTAHAAVRPGGRVRGVDVSAAMIDRARRLAGGADGLEFAVGAVDAAGGDRYDAVLSRWSLTFAEDPAATAAALASRMRPGGRFAAAVWGPPGQVPMISLGFATIGRHLELPPPPPGGPGPFALADAGALADVAARAGLREIAVEEVRVPFRLDTAHDYRLFTAAVLPRRMRDVVAERCAGTGTDALWDAVTAAAAERALPGGGIDLTSVALCLRAVR